MLKGIVDVLVVRAENLKSAVGEEIMSDKIKLTIELVSQGSHYTNLRSIFSRKDWDLLRRHCYKKADYKCEICGGVGRKHPVECHEMWFYSRNHEQRLDDLIALCPRCHEVKHIGLAQVKGRLHEARGHLMLINHWDKTTANKYIDKAFDIYQERSLKDWEVDVTYGEKLLKQLKEEDDR